MMQKIKFQPGVVLYKYKLIKQIGEGGFGDVWLAYDRSVGRNIAVKVLDSSMIPIAEHLNEARIGNRLNHQNLVKVQYADVVPYNKGNIVIIAMDYYENGSIIKKLNSRGFIPIPFALHYITDVLRGLEYLHHMNFLHGDIKPQNILIGPSDEGIITDYGISCFCPDSLPVQPKSMYNLHIAPETLINKKISVQTDIYQIGLSAFRLMNGIDSIKEKYYTLGKEAYFKLVEEGKIVKSDDYLPFIPRNIKAVINKAISLDPYKRYQTALDMRRTLERLNFPGFWTCDSYGNYVGFNDKYAFRYELIANNKNNISLSVFKKSLSTNRETKIPQFCRKNALQNQVPSIIQKFMLSIVNGKK